MRTYPGWAAADQARFKAMMVNLFYPINAGAIHIPTGSSLLVYSNWDLGCVASMIAIGVLTDDRAKFDAAVGYFKAGLGNGGIGQALYYIHPGYLGQTQESGRDQGHDTLSVSLLGNICEMAWNQGVDLYGFDNNRFLAGAEYVAKGNLIQSGTTYYSVPFATYKNASVTDTVFATGGQGALRPEWTLIYNHYVNRKGLAAPYTEKFVALTEPEGGGGNYGPNSGGYDQLGYGTLTYTRDPIAAGAPPSGLTAIVSAGQVVLSWWGTAYATSYVVKRSASPGGPYTTIATGISDLLTYTDRNLAAGTYHYVVSAVAPTGETAPSNEATAITAMEPQTYLAFDDGSGTGATDSSGSAHGGTLVNGATWAPGKKGSAVSLDGTNGYVTLPADLMADVGDFTIATWVYWNAARTSERVFDFGANIDHYMMLSARGTTGVVRFAITVNGAAGEQTIDGTAALTTNQWVHVAVTLSGGIGTLYVNGRAVGTNPGMLLAPFRLGGTIQNWIGRSQYAADPYFNGLVDDFRIYWGALSAADIAVLSAG
jgi:Concanavalin A-like lectin/glucanases superfamily/Alginate lyase